MLQFAASTTKAVFVPKGLTEGNASPAVTARTGTPAAPSTEQKRGYR